MIPVLLFVIEDEDDRTFMTNLFIQYQKLMYSTILKIISDSWMADDIFQISLEKLIKKVDLLKTMNQDHLIGYIITTCRNTALNICYQQRKYSSLVEETQHKCFEDTVSPDHDVEIYIIKQYNLESLRQIWADLDDRSRILLESKYILEKKDTEIAHDLGMKTESVRMALTRARRKAFCLMEKIINEPRE